MQSKVIHFLFRIFQRGRYFGHLSKFDGCYSIDSHAIKISRHAPPKKGSSRICAQIVDFARPASLPPSVAQTCSRKQLIHSPTDLGTQQDCLWELTQRMERNWFHNLEWNKGFYCIPTQFLLFQFAQTLRWSQGFPAFSFASKSSAHLHTELWLTVTTECVCTVSPNMQQWVQQDTIICGTICLNEMTDVTVMPDKYWMMMDFSIWAELRKP